MGDRYNVFFTNQETMKSQMSHIKENCNILWNCFWILSYHVLFRINESKSSTMLHARVLGQCPIPCCIGNKVAFPLVSDPVIWAWRNMADRWFWRHVLGWTIVVAHCGEENCFSYRRNWIPTACKPSSGNAVLYQVIK